MRDIIAGDAIEQRIYLIHGQKVMLSFHLAALYEVTPKALLQAVKRNLELFPDDFMFRLTKDEAKALRSQIVTLHNTSHFRYLPYAFTEHGIAMLSSVLKSKRARQMNIAIIRAFVRLRKILAANNELASRLKDLEQKVNMHDKDILMIFQAINKLMAPEPKEPKRVIGFQT